MNTEAEFSILLVDDEASNLYILNQLLKESYSIYAAKTGKAAIISANKNKPDLILLDIIMPNMSGFEVLSELKKSSATCDIPVIFISGLDDTEDERKGLQLGAVDYIKKPFNNLIVKTRIETQFKMIKQLRLIEESGSIDALTEMPNRRNFDDKICLEWARALRERTQLSILMIDIDNFKKLNDTYGHLQGDVVLKTISKIFVSALKRATDLAFRWGGEEFVVILPNTNLKGALNVAENIRVSVEKTAISNISDNEQIFVTVSIGAFTAIPTVDSSIEAFISKADEALYVAKKTGKNKVCS